MGKEKWRDLLCPKCHQLKKTCTCTSEPSTPSKTKVVRVGRETKGRRGKGVTIISELPLDQDGLTEFAAKLKTRLGTGGTVKEGASRSRAIIGIGLSPSLKRWATEPSGLEGNRREPANATWLP